MRGLKEAHTLVQGLFLRVHSEHFRNSFRPQRCSGESLMRFEQRKQNFRANLRVLGWERLGRALRWRLLEGILKAKRQQGEWGFDVMVV
jgi:hypothetical protein